MPKSAEKPVSYIEISPAAVVENVRSFKKILADTTAIACVVKANAYGHGLAEIVRTLEDECEYFQIDDVEELTQLRKYSKKPALVLGYMKAADVVRAQLLAAEVAIFSREHARAIHKTSSVHGANIRAHVAIDALLGREGVTLQELPKLLSELKTYPAIDIIGVYAHFANIEDTSDFTHAEKQIDAFKKARELFARAGFNNLKTHIAATSGILAHEQIERSNTIVRLGIGTYGMWPSEELRQRHGNSVSLQPVMRWVSHTAQIKKLPAHYPIGYGLTYITPHPMTVAVIPQGYSDGYDRGLSNTGEVLIRGSRCRVLGRVAMNMFVVDVSHVPGVDVQDEVILLGTQHEEEIAAEEIANKLQTINYEITARLSPLLPRVVLP